jgi:hypothetical protein
MFAYCLNNPTSYTDITGTTSNAIVPIWDYWVIHKMVQQEITLYYGFEMEVYVTSPQGHGFLDLYDTRTNQYYEVKHKPAATTQKTIDQMNKYDNSIIKDWRFAHNPIDSSPTRGTNTSIRGSFNYSIYTITYEWTAMGLITYSVNYSPEAMAQLAMAIGICLLGGAARSALDKTSGGQLSPAHSMK